MNLVTLSSALSALPVPPTGVIDVINQAAKLRSYVDTIEAIAGVGAGSWINLGSFTISGPGGSSLLNTASAALGSLGLSNWSSLVSSGGGVNYEGVKSQIVGLLGSDVGDQVNHIFESLNSSSEDMGGITFDFPIVKDPTGVAMGMLLGQDKDLVTVSARLDLEFDKAIPIIVIPGFKIQIAGQGDVHAFAQLGYDTRGIREAITPLYTGGNFDVSKTLNGLWVSGETHIDVNGSLDLQTVAGFDPIAAFTAEWRIGRVFARRFVAPGQLQSRQPQAAHLCRRLFLRKLVRRQRPLGRARQSQAEDRRRCAGGWVRGLRPHVAACQRDAVRIQYTAYLDAGIAGCAAADGRATLYLRLVHEYAHSPCRAECQPA